MMQNVCVCVCKGGRKLGSNGMGWGHDKGVHTQNANRSRAPREYITGMSGRLENNQETRIREATLIVF